ncbi:Putative exodeoxyribonuclease 8, PDDEXK-like domain containing protein [uncultured Caudovirales phage]|uniref:Exodeoxyribonuclease 8, PDDEXK-like domain containing protein n=1 Tax=uncultured Caudovirales phage TaxID=2100421 RepID=A0A6J7X829_9CAUD|nr:Putative exodeoxyribonuclease 8, PDDEXK-like domain containing protein [uncultured Caudovirales phage]
MKNELILDLEMSEYRKLEGLSKHQLDSFGVCPAYYKWRGTQEWKASRDMEIGTCIHSLLLEGRTDYVQAPEVNRRTNAGKAEWEAFCVDNQGKFVMNAEEVARIEGATEAAKPLLGMVTAKKIIEGSMFWERGGMQCKGRPDLITEIKGKPAIVDLKTTSDIMRFDSKFFSLKYDRQAAWYAYGLKQIHGLDQVDFYFLVVDTEMPHLAQWVKPDDEVLYKADLKLDEAVAGLKHCIETDTWPGLPTIRTIGSRKWD